MRLCEVGACRAEAPYQCPRCDVRYCTVACYTQHSSRCVAAFARSADDALRGVRIGDLQRTQANDALLDAMRRLALDDEDDDDERHDANERLRLLLHDLEAGNLTFEEGVARLPGTLADDFCAMLKDVRLLRDLQVWVPWWAVDSTTPLPSPPVKEDLAVTVSAARAHGASALRYSVVDVVATYCRAMRIYDGDANADAPNFARLIVRQCETLAVDARHTTTLQALCGRRCDDVMAIYGGGRSWVCRALADTARALQAGGRRTRARKVRFLLAWQMGEDDNGVRQILRDMTNAARADADTDELQMLRVAKRCATAER